MIRLRLFGALDIEADGADCRALVAHPKRIALLAFLALRANRSALARDSLLPVFWPESDESRARGALRNALHFLRSRLGKGTVATEGDRLRLVDVWCDAAEFENLLERGELEEALELYRGDLLEGFFLSDAPDFEAWLEEERGRLRRRAVDACWSLVDEAEESERLALAARYARRALGLVPTDEVGARRLLALLARSGDITGALRAHEEFADRLERLYEIEPSEDTNRLVTAIRRGDVGPAPASEPEPEVEPTNAGPPATGGVEAAAAPDARPARRLAEAAPAAQPARTPASGSPDGRSSARSRRLAARPGGNRRGRRWAAWVAGAAALLAVAIAAGFGAGDEPPPDPSGSTDAVVAVLPFAYQGGDALRFLGEGVARLVSDALNGAGDLRTVDRRAIDSFVAQREGADEVTVAIATARRFGATYYVLGDVMEQDSIVHVTVTLRRVADERAAAGHTATAEGSAADVFGLVDGLARHLLAGMGYEGLEGSAVRAGSPLAALKAFLRGEAAARAGWYREAMDEFGVAVVEDSTFALAHYGLSAAAYGAGVPVVPTEAAAAARRHSASLPRSDQLFLEAWANHLNARVPEAETFYRQAVAMQPTHVDGWLQLGELLYHWGPTAGTSVEAARRPFEQALALEPGDAGAALHLARLLARGGDRQGIRSLVSAAGAGTTAPWVLEMEALDAFTSDDERLQEASIDAIVSSGEQVGTALLASLSANTSRLDAAAELARALLAPGRGATERAAVRALLVRIELARGRLSIARQEVDQAPELPESTRRELAAALELLPFLRLDSARHALIQDLIGDGQLDRPLPPQTDPVWMGSNAFPPLRWNGLLRERRLLLDGLCHARAGAFEAARGTADRIEAMESEDAAAYPGLIRATIALEREDGQAALDALGPPRRPPGGRREGLRDYARPLERWLRAEALAAVGRPREALRWYATFPGADGGDLWYAAPALLRRAELHEALGEFDSARDLYAAFYERMRGAEGYLQDDLQRALDGLGRLEE